MEGGGGLAMVARSLFGATLGTSGTSRLCPNSSEGAWTGRLGRDRFRSAPFRRQLCRLPEALKPNVHPTLAPGPPSIHPLTEASGPGISCPRILTLFQPSPPQSLLAAGYHGEASSQVHPGR